MSEEYPIVSHQLLSDCGINPFAVQLLAESIMRHPNPKPVRFLLPVNRSDCAGFSGLKVYLEPVPKEQA